MNRTIPIINTARLSLRAMLPEDFDRYAEIWAMQDVVEHISGTPLTRGEAWTSFLRNAGHWQMTGFGQWAVTEARSRRLVGQTGFFFRARGLGADFDAYPEAGWVLAPEAQGRGLGAEATKAAHDWFDRVVTGPLVAIIAEGNAPSCKLADSLGYRPLRTVEMQGDPVLLMRRNGPPGAR
ncbi:GNAT family N-acetyltransferase [Thalassococcus sp. S3]|uniref:GNAT family N-acetyltransferase n=1 Tax=Thalassococcus sp. S3 TaxID=2017482 RepID=UPI00102418BE|nr:GNAT family N-acetyltransferase [Thalassococcus sp. S3]QBF32284.1 GNAT family N-acetyltransferase [Thalassococcus sp. S3]